MIAYNSYASWVKNLRANCLSYLRHATSEIQKAIQEHSDAYDGNIKLLLMHAKWALDLALVIIMKLAIIYCMLKGAVCFCVFFFCVLLSMDKVA